MTAPCKRLEVKVEGIVQGVGFRPFVHGLANRYGLGGSVRNDADGVKIEVEGAVDDLDRFIALLRTEAPPLAVIVNLEVRELERRKEGAFSIDASRSGTARSTPISPDVATCDECLREMLDPSERRFLYPFINCTNCGPRYTIVEDVPYDRARTTMSSFDMCEACEREYHDPADRRFHAQPVACPRCGPRLAVLDSGGSPLSGDPIATTARLLLRENVVAIKGLGGFHLAADARNEAAVAALRARKHREEKPFALMVSCLEDARALVEMSPSEERLLAGARRPIVLLQRRDGADVAPSVAPGCRYLGVMLPYTPVHHLLARALGAPIVLTSGNVTDEPIAYLDAEARARLSGIADAFLTHDRPIHVRSDDSVFRVFDDAPLPLRRARGYAPQPIVLSERLPRHVLACGAELKNTICVAKGRFAYLSHHIGDLENYESYRSFLDALAHLCRLFDVEPQIIAHDLHPEYLSTQWALEQRGVELVGVQHHHAHVVACLADNQEAGPAIGVVYDGLGYGSDGTFWGGEFLVADRRTFERIGHWSPVPMPGGGAAIREPWRMAAAHLDQAFEGRPPALPVSERHPKTWEKVVGVARRAKLSPLTSSVGRLFDAVAALAGVRDVNVYEGQAAIELEQRACTRSSGSYPIDLVVAPRGFTLPSSEVVRAVVRDVEGRVDPSLISARFHDTMARATVLGCAAARAATGLELVALSGGVFQNLRLLRTTVDGLAASGFRVLVHRQVPPNDGGISLGQAVVAASAAAG
ncbi:MAG TPA: carbamoyltransferase HypF [Polyangiaceae bacterium]